MGYPREYDLAPNLSSVITGIRSGERLLAQIEDNAGGKIRSTLRKHLIMACHKYTPLFRLIKKIRVFTGANLWY